MEFQATKHDEAQFNIPDQLWSTNRSIFCKAEFKLKSSGVKHRPQKEKDNERQVKYIISIFQAQTAEGPGLTK